MGRSALLISSEWIILQPAGLWLSKLPVLCLETQAAWQYCLCWGYNVSDYPFKLWVYLQTYTGVTNTQQRPCFAHPFSWKQSFYFFKFGNCLLHKVECEYLCTCEHLHWMRGTLGLAHLIPIVGTGKRNWSQSISRFAASWGLPILYHVTQASTKLYCSSYLTFPGLPWQSQHNSVTIRTRSDLVLHLLKPLTWQKGLLKLYNSQCCWLFQPLFLLVQL